jgi:HAD superfamily hydrolase (TIGR01549 family)
LTIKAVLFDMGNTLVKYNYNTPEEVFQKILFSLGISRSLDNIKKAFVKAEKEAKETNLLSLSGKIKCEDFWYRWDSLVLKHLKVEENKELPGIIHSKWMKFVDCTLYPEVREVMSELKRREMKIGLISNAYEGEIDLVLEKADLDRATFDIIVGVDTTRKVKPNPDIFKYVIGNLNVKLREALFIGDSVDVDYKGAENAGIHALLIHRKGKQQSSVKTIKNLKEILSQIT